LNVGLTSGWIDQLSYTYYSGTNKLKNVVDASNDPATMRVMDGRSDGTSKMPTISSTADVGDADIHTHTVEGRSFTLSGRSGRVGKGKEAFGGVYGNDLSRDSYQTPGKEKYRSGYLGL